MLDDDDGVARIDEPVEHVEQALHVREMEAGRRLVEDVEGPPGRPARELGRELDPLRLAPGERRRGLTEVDVAEAHVVQRAQLLLARRDVGEERERLLDGHLQDVGDALALVMDLERLAVVPLAAADLAWNVDVRQELHLDLDDPVAGARLAASTLHVEGEAARGVAAQARLGDSREQLADRREEPGVGGGIRSRRPADWRLIDLDHLVHQRDALDRVVSSGLVGGLVQRACERAIQDVVDERRLARSADAGDGGEDAEGNRDVNVLQVVRPRATDDELAFHRRSTAFRNRNRPRAGQVRAGERRPGV